MLSQLGCELNVQLDERAQGVERDLGVVQEGTLKVRFEELASSDPSASWSWAIELKELETGRVVMREWIGGDFGLPLTPLDQPLEGASQELMSDTLPRAPVEVSLPSLARASYLVTLFKEAQGRPEAGGAPRFSPCPSPASPIDPFSLSEVDPLVATWRGALNDELTVTLTPQRVSCGVGELSTIVSGEVIAPAERLGALLLTLDPLEGTSSVSAGSAQAFPLTPFLLFTEPLSEVEREELELPELERGWRRALWRVPQLAAGRHALTVSSDHDQDQRLSPCDLNSKTGADDWRSETRELVVSRGLTTPLERPLVTRQVTDCEALSSSLELLEAQGSSEGEGTTAQPPLIAARGQLVVTEALKLALTPLIDPLTGDEVSPQLMYQLGEESPKPLLNLQELTRSRGRFTLLIHPSDLTTPRPLTLWVDAGGDERFEPCDGEPLAGVDVRWWQGDSLSLTLLDGAEAPPSVELEQRCEAPEAVISGEVNFELSPGELWGPRHLILTREDLFSGERVAHDLGVLTRAQLVAGARRFEQRVTQGSYAYQAFLDQDGDERLSACSERSLGERSLGDVFATLDESLISVRRGEHSARHLLRLTPLPCLSATTTLKLSFEGGLKQRSVEGRCPQGEVELSLRSGAQALIDQRCVPLQEGSTLSLPGLYRGLHQLDLCLAVEPVDVETLGCEAAGYLVGRYELEVREAPQQEELISLETACACPLSVSP